MPGRRPPLLITRAGAKNLRPGSVVVDLAAGLDGGNVEGVPPCGTVVRADGVALVAAPDLPSDMAAAASAAYSRNIEAVLGILIKDGAIDLDPDDEIVRAIAVPPQRDQATVRAPASEGSVR